MGNGKSACTRLYPVSKFGTEIQHVSAWRPRNKAWCVSRQRSGRFEWTRCRPTMDTDMTHALTHGVESASYLMDLLRGHDKTEPV